MTKLKVRKIGNSLGVVTCYLFISAFRTIGNVLVIIYATHGWHLEMNGMIDKPLVPGSSPGGPTICIEFMALWRSDQGIHSPLVCLMAECMDEEFRGPSDSGRRHLGNRSGSLIRRHRERAPAGVPPT